MCLLNKIRMQGSNVMVELNFTIELHCMIVGDKNVRSPEET